MRLVNRHTRNAIWKHHGRERLGRPSRAVKLGRRSIDGRGIGSDEVKIGSMSKKSDVPGDPPSLGDGLAAQASERVALAGCLSHRTSSALTTRAV